MDIDAGGHRVRVEADGEHAPRRDARDTIIAADERWETLR
jgi:hypothetical protein